ncbi:hypothetical protein P6709_19535 [Jeotgalibacillus sp. ET6]|nr:hypothetical protein [Jeotgalibacillus sp. ET6]MDG5473923.1 hypothetical protein [Jeotgalibacillus sp. ET6]
MVGYLELFKEELEEDSCDLVEVTVLRIDPEQLILDFEELKRGGCNG